MVPHVGIVDSGPKVICIVWMEQIALKHTNTCMRWIVVEERELVRKRHAHRGNVTKMASKLSY